MPASYENPPLNPRIRRGHGRSTLADVALAAGVTKITVSRYLREPDKVAPATAARIAREVSVDIQKPGQQSRVSQINHPCSGWNGGIPSGDRRNTIPHNHHHRMIDQDTRLGVKQLAGPNHGDRICCDRLR